MKKDFKKKVLDWIKSEGIDIGDKRVRVYDYRGDMEVRIYNEPMEFANTKKSRRMLKNPTDEYNCTFGIHSRKISTYIHVNETDFNKPEEKEFIIECLKA
jgi:hypothetical protein